MTLAQTSIFDFEPKPEAKPEEEWLLAYDGSHAFMYRTDAESFCSTLGSLPTEGLWLRCMEIDHKASFNRWCPWAEAEVCWHGSMNVVKLLDTAGRVEEYVDPYPHGHYFENGKMVRERVHARVLDARVEGSVLSVELEGFGTMLAEVREDSECSRWDVHPYDPA